MIFCYHYEGISDLFFDAEGPTEDDVLTVNKGLLDVYRINGEDVRKLDEDGDWVPAASCEIIVACGSEFHEPA
jgi:hypothetical protein